MKISEIRIIQVRGFKDSGILRFSNSINIFIGPNNSGKSTIIKALYCLQIPSALVGTDTRAKVNSGKVLYKVSDLGDSFQSSKGLVGAVNLEEDKEYDLAIDLVRGNGVSLLRRAQSQQWQSTDPALTVEPHNLFYPFFSKRKVVVLSQNVDMNSVTRVPDNFEYLVSKVDRLQAPRDKNHHVFREACREVLGFEVSTVASEGGKKIGFLIDTFNNISLENMGDGVAHILAMISNLCVSENKIYLIEEIENDLHPKALKFLLKMIIDKSTTNQFFLSTHSNIVAKYLGSAENAKLFNVSADFSEDIPSSMISEIPNDTPSRIEVLQELGYEFHDFWLHQGWLLLEESSAEVIIRDYLIPWFFPKLVQKLGTVSANGISKIEPSFEDYKRLFVFLHLEHAYKNKTWVWVDGDEPGKESINKLKEKFGKAGWDDSTFSHFQKEWFEDYYPAHFGAEVESLKTIKDKAIKMAKKRDLIESVKKWINENPNAKGEFEESAKEIIQKLSVINSALT